MVAVQRASAYRAGWSAGLPYPVRNVWRRRRGLLGMILGVGIALGLGMTMLAVSQASIEVFTGDYRASSADLYVTTEGGKPIPILAGETPGTIENARHVMAQLRGLPGVTAVLGEMTWTLERERPGPRVHDAPKELLTVMGVEGDPNDIPGALRLDQGRWPRRTDEIMVGAKLAREKPLSVGETVRLAGRDFTVVGIGRLRGFGFSRGLVRLHRAPVAPAARPDRRRRQHDRRRHRRARPSRARASTTSNRSRCSAPPTSSASPSRRTRPAWSSASSWCC